ncbi:MAG: DNA adenine methylase [Gaiellales bacterium]
MIKYLGSKRALAPLIRLLAGHLPVRSAGDLFAGTTRVGQALRAAGLHVVSNDLASYSQVLGQAYIEADESLDRGHIQGLLSGLNALPGRAGYVTEVFCRRARYFHPDNGMRIDAIRAGIDALELSPVERGVLLTSLLEAADRVDSTVGLQMAYLKHWAPRALNRLELREPEPVAGPAGRTLRLDANRLAPELDGIDLAYVDPPYNQHSYFSNYHVWETLVRNDSPEHYGVACKRLDCRLVKSPYNSRRAAWDTLVDLVRRAAPPWLIVSLSNEGFHDPDAVADLLAQRGYVGAVAVDSRRYVGAQIGIHDPSGRRVGRVSHLRNTELVFVVGPSRTIIDRVLAAADRAVPRLAS